MVTQILKIVAAVANRWQHYSGLFPPMAYIPGVEVTIRSYNDIIILQLPCRRNKATENRKCSDYCQPPLHEEAIPQCTGKVDIILKIKSIINIKKHYI